jgi:hypothetical protein
VRGGRAVSRRPTELAGRPQDDGPPRDGGAPAQPGAPAVVDRPIELRESDAVVRILVALVVLALLLGLVVFYPVSPVGR